MTRIVLAASSYLPRLGGVEEHVYHLARELAGRGHDVSVWTVDQGDELLEAPDGVAVRHLPTPMPNRSAGGVARWVGRFPRAARLWRRAAHLDRPQVLDIQCYGANGPYATALARITRTPLVYSNHGETFMDAHRTFDTSALMRRAIGRTLVAADRVTSCSSYAADDLVRFGRVPTISIVGNGIDLDLPCEPVDVPLPNRYIAGVGRLVANKGFDRLIAAYADAYLDGQLVDVDLVIAGEGPEREALQRLASELGVSHRTAFVGPLSRGQVRSLLDDAVAHVVPSHVEAFGIVVLEGWRSATPVLVTDRGGPPEFVKDRVDGLLFDPDDTGALSRLLVEVTSDAALRDRIGSAGRASAARFSWAAVADHYETVFDSAIAASHSKRKRKHL